jgi:hypothetical protein
MAAGRIGIWEQVGFIGTVAHDETEILGEGELRSCKLGIPADSAL